MRYLADDLQNGPTVTEGESLPFIITEGESLPKVQLHLLFAPVIPRLRICPACIPTHISWCMSKIIYYSIDDDIEGLDG